MKLKQTITTLWRTLGLLMFIALAGFLLRDTLIPRPQTGTELGSRDRWRETQNITMRRDQPEIKIATPPRSKTLANRIPAPGPHITVHSEALAKTGVAEYHAHGYLGAGVKVAIIDNQYAGLQARVAEGELPADLISKRFSSNGDIHETLTPGDGAHGVACAEIIHDIAPAAQLYLIQVENFAGSLAAVLDYLHSEGVDIVSISLSALAPGRDDGSGSLANSAVPLYAILDDARTNKGLLIVQSAGNYARQHYRGNFNDPDGDAWHTFTTPGTDDEKALPIYAQDEKPLTLYLSWHGENGSAPAQPGFRLYLYDENADEIQRPPQSQGDWPQEMDTLTFTPERGRSYYIKIQKQGTFTQPLQLDLFVKGDVIPLARHQVAAGSLAAPADSAAVLTVGAANVRNDTLLSYSSQGPTRDGRIKPDVTSYAYVSVASPDYDPRGFFGTSAATPHVAGMAAVLKSHPANAALTVAELQALLLRDAVDRGTPGKDNQWGAGIAQLPPLGITLQIISPTLDSAGELHTGSAATKIRVELAVRRSDGTPLAGLQPNDFAVKLAGQNGTPITARDNNGRYTLEVIFDRPLTAGPATLHVSAGGQEATQPQTIAPAPTDTLASAALTLYSDRNSYQSNTPLHIQASLSARRALGGAWVRAHITRPNGELDTMTLHDDGLHADGIAEDGIYGGTYTRTSTEGEYRIEVLASGQTSTGSAFEQRAQLQRTFVANADDSDSDGMPDNWEHSVGLHATLDDAHNDYDADGLINLHEYRHGSDPFDWDSDGDTLGDAQEVRGYYITDPNNVDSDGGGSDDAQERALGGNPRNPRDDEGARNMVYLPPVLRDHAPSPTAVNASVYQGDILWIATLDGLVRWDQSNDRYRKYTRVDGLADNRVYALAVAPDGALWCGTQQGVSVFDGSTWRSYSSADGLPHNHVRALSISAQGEVWIATPRGAAAFDGTVWRSYTPADSLIGADVYAVAVDKKARVWFGTRSGVSMLENQRWTSYRAPTGLTANWVNAILAAADGTLWFGTWGGGVSSLSPAGAWQTHTPQQGLAGSYIRGISQDRQGHIWTRSTQGISTWDGANWTTYALSDGDMNSIPAGTPYAVTLTEQGRQAYIAAAPLALEARIALQEQHYAWFARYPQRSSVTHTWTTYATSAPQTTPPAEGSVYALAVDGANHLWVGTDRGIGSFDGETWALLPPSDATDKRAVRALAIDGDNTLWAGRDGGGVLTVDTRAGHDPSNSLLNSHYIHALAVDADGSLWAGSGNGRGGISQWRDGRWASRSTESSLAGIYIKAIVRSPAGATQGMWFGGEHGLSHFDGAQWHTYPRAAVLNDAHVNALAAGQDGTIWVGTQTGLRYFDGQRWHSPATDDPTNSACISAIAIENAVSMWIGTCADGVIQRRGEHSTAKDWRSYTQRDGLASDKVFAVVIDQQGHKWFGTDAGLSEFTEKIP